MSVLEKLRSLVHKHHANFVAQVGAVDRLLNEQNAEGCVAHENVAKAQEITHQMKGTAGSMGFPELGNMAADLDIELKRLRRIDGPVAPAEMRDALALLAALRSAATQTTPEMSKLYDTDLSQM